MMRSTRIALVGYGNVGKAVVKLLSETDPRGKTFVFSAVATRFFGVIDLGDSPASLVEERIAKTLSSSKSKKTAAKSGEIASWLIDSNYDVLVELTHSDYKDAEPALTYIRASLENGKDVVTANKGPIVLALDELESICDRTGARLRFESTVMDGTPIFSLFREAMPSVRIKKIRGVLNSTTNIVLEQLSQGKTLKDGIEKAKSLGVAEADPSLDLKGTDAAAKLVILANALNHANIKMVDVSTQPLTEKTYQAAKKLETVKAQGKIKQVVVADFEKRIFRVGLEGIKPDDPLYVCKGRSNIVSFSTNLFGEFTIASREPTLRETAFGVYSDLINLRKGKNS